MKKEKMLLICLPILCAIAAIVGYLKVINKDTNIDAIKFKEEYEALNGTVVYEDLKYSNLNISENNPMKYSNYDELLDIIENKSGVIYLGFPGCPWCRSALPILLEAAKENEINTIYYLNILNERDAYVVEDGELVYQVDENGNEKKGTKGYYKLLEALDEHLTEYVVSYKDKEYETGEKRIYAPTVIFVRDGKVLGLHVSTVESQKSGFDKMTKEQKEELFGIYEDYILEMKNSTCSSDSAC
ncbi:MAG: hypothetical protein IKL65_01610 [Bacilli bacterium]|nr:hypothetical protein [Bacilli bacterium]